MGASSTSGTFMSQGLIFIKNSFQLEDDVKTVVETF